jgi:predicted phosphodiesterase
MAITVAALYDIHGNLPALERVIDEVRELGVDEIVIGGDVIPGPMPHETLAYLRALDLPLQFIHGNGELAVLEERAGRDSGVPAQFRGSVRWCAEQLAGEEAHFIAGWPATISRQIAGLGEVLFCHATPRSSTEIFIRTTPEEKVLPAFEGMGETIVICGHTHMQFDRAIGSKRVINAGSVGMPFGAPGAYWLLPKEKPELRYTSYDLETAANRVRLTNYPGATDFAAQNILHPPTEGQMLEPFAKAEMQS